MAVINPLQLNLCSTFFSNNSYKKCKSRSDTPCCPLRRTVYRLGMWINRETIKQLEITHVADVSWISMHFKGGTNPCKLEKNNHYFVKHTFIDNTDHAVISRLIKTREACGREGRRFIHAVT